MLTDTQLRSLTFQGTQRDYPDRDGMFVRVGVRRKTFMLTISQNGRHPHETRGEYPGWQCRAGAARAIRGLARASAQHPSAIWKVASLIGLRLGLSPL